MEIGYKLLLLRKKNNYSQEYIAENIGISQSTYSRLESDRTILKGYLLKRFCDFYNIPLSYFLLDTNYIIPKDREALSKKLQDKERLIHQLEEEISDLMNEVNILKSKLFTET
jgi:transcriptional regulator with XRE-family HTH domain